MTFSDIASIITPGFEFLSDKQKTNFLQTLAGQQFSALISSTLDALNQINAQDGWLKYFSGKTNQEKQALEDTFSQQKEALLECLNSTEEYQTLIVQITINLLKTEYQDFNTLSKIQQKTLAQMDFSQNLRKSLASINQSKQKLHHRGFLRLFVLSIITDVTTEFENLNNEKIDTLNAWENIFLNTPEMAIFHSTIQKNKEFIREKKIADKLALLNEHATQLANFFPLLNYRKFTYEQPVIDQIRAKYLTLIGETTVDVDKIDLEHITDLLLHCLCQGNQIEINFIDLEAFNKKHAKIMAIAILDAFQKKSTLDLDSLFQKYETKMHKYLLAQMQLVNGKAWEIKQVGIMENVYGSLSILWNNKAIEKTEEFLNKMADAHGFIQATGFATQNENSYFAILDMYNYKRYNTHITEAKDILISLFSPLLPLYEEYREIAFHEKNTWLKMFRSLMPIIVTVGCIILVAAALTPLALPELAFAAAFIPAIFAGLGLATKYVTFKNYLYKNIRDYHYGGAFEIPEFQINPRMTNAFGDETIAEEIRKFYIEELKRCDNIEYRYAIKHEHGILNQKDIDLRKENTNKRHQICLEWYDIHSNKDLNYEEAPLIALNRLQQIGDNAYSKLQTTLENEVSSIRKKVSQVASDLKTTLVTHNKPLIVKKDKTSEIEDSTIKTTQYKLGLFSKPRCLTHKMKMEKLDKLREQINLVTP